MEALGGQVNIGGTVTIAEGPLAGMAARIKGVTERRIVVIIKLRGRDVPVEMDRAWVSAAPRRKPRASSSLQLISSSTH